MNIPKFKEITIDNQTFRVDKEVFSHYKEMHPIRTDDSLKHDVIKFIGNENKISSATIEKMIQEEYYYYSQMNLPELTKKARILYENSLQYDSEN